MENLDVLDHKLDWDIFFNSEDLFVLGAEAELNRVSHIFVEIKTDKILVKRIETVFSKPYKPLFLDWF
jgi:hypothetical protein